MRPAHVDLAALIDLLGRPAVLRHLNVHRTTLMRWESGAYRMPTRTHHLVRELLGHLPGTDGQWQGWRFWKGLLHDADGNAYAEHQVAVIPVNLALIAALQARVKDLEAQVARLSVDPWVRERAANDAASLTSTSAPQPAASPMQGQVPRR